MPALGYYPNVDNTALVLLQQKGFRVWIERDGHNFCAERDGWDFMAGDPVQLLGLIAIFEARQPTTCSEYWWRIEEPWLLDSIPRKKPDYIPIWKRK